MNPIKLFKVEKKNAVYVFAGVFVCGRCGTIYCPPIGKLYGFTNSNPREQAEECCICTICKKPAINTEAQEQGSRITKLEVHDECRRRVASQRSDRREREKLDNAEVVEWDDYEGEGFFVGEQYYADSNAYEDALNDPDSELPDAEFGWAAKTVDPQIDIGNIWRDLSERYDGEDATCPYAGEALLNTAVDAFNKLNVGRGLWWPDDQLKVRLPRREKGADE